MARDRKRPESSQQQSTKFGNQPFRGLNQLATQLRKAEPPVPRPEPKPAPMPEAVALDPAEEFLRAVAGARPLGEQARQRVEKPPPASPPREMTDADAEALAELCDLVSGAAPFDLTQSDEHIEGFVIGLDPRLVRRLRRGEFAYQDHVDLHGMTSDEARVKVEEFLTRAYRAKKRCVLIIHGRGLNSKDQVPVLKTRLAGWLTRGQWARWVLAFTSARPCDGGVGALYVLLRRDRSARHAMQVTNGAKW